MVHVSRVERPTPGCVRVTFAGDELKGYEMRGPAAHIKVLFGAPGKTRPLLPEWGPEGPVLAEGQQMPPSRTYTPRSYDPSRNELVVEFMLHGDGLAASWAKSVKAGDEVAVTLPGGAYAVEPADWYLFGGDESALPAIETILEELPDVSKAQVIVEVRGPDEERNLAAQHVTWLHRNGSDAGRRLEAAIKALEVPGGQGRVWVGCEAAVMRDIRKHLLFERGMDREAIHTHGYWKQGASNHPDHDVGQEI
jgi:NADPH-dependent ferric siderophore reductase